MDSQKDRKPGRPRNADLDDRVLKITLRQLAEQGYSRLSIDSIAETAGVSKPSIYRRWPGKADLATAALSTLQVSEPVVDTGDTRQDLVGVLTNFRKNLLRPNGMTLIGTVLAEEAITPELMELFRERIVKPRRRMLRKILERADERGELKPAVEIRAAVHMLVGAFYAHYLAKPEIGKDFPQQIVDIVWAGIAKGAGR